MAAIDENARAERATRWIMLLFLVAFGFALKAGAWHFFGIGLDPARHALIDFDVFHMAGRLVWLGRAGDAYDPDLFGNAQRAISGRHGYMPWTYPPPFDLVVALFALLPLGFAYLAFIVPALVTYLLSLYRIVGEPPVAVVALLLVPLCVTVVCGQNGLLTGTLAGLAAIGLLRGRRWAGVPLGLMVIKPHLILGLALYTLIDRRWSVVGIALLTVLMAGAAATLALGPGIWLEFLAGARLASSDLAIRFYPLHRMISPFAALRSLGVAAPAAFAAQALVAATALAGVVIARRQLGTREAIGAALLAGLLVSPYAYDYDLPVFGIGLALVLPAILRAATTREIAAIGACIMIAGGMGIGQVLAFPATTAVAAREVPRFVTLAGLLLVVAGVLIWRVLARDRGEPVPAR